MKLTVIALLAASLLVPGCKKSAEDSDNTQNNKGPEPSAKVTEPGPTKVAAKPAITEIPITTKSEEARAEFLKARDLMEQTSFLVAAPHLEKALELDPDFAMAHAHLSLIAGEGRDENRAKARALAGSLPVIEKLYVDSMVVGTPGDPQSSVSAMEDLVRGAANSPRALRQAGIFYVFQMQDYEKGVTYLKRTIALDRKQPEAFNSLSYAYRNLGKLDLAIEAAKTQVALMPGAANPIDTLADMELAGGKFADAEANYRKAFAADKTFTLSLAGAAVTQLYRRDFKGAAATFEEAAKAETVPQQRFARTMDLVMMKAIAGDTKGALAAAADLGASAKVLGFNGPSTVAMARSRIHLHAGDYKSAQREMGIATKALTKGKSAGFRAGFTHMAHVLTSARVGDKATAKKAFAAMEETLKGGPPHLIASAHLDWVSGDVEAALKKLESLKGSPMHNFSLDAAVAILDGAKRPDEAEAKRKEIRQHFSRMTDEVMIWLQHTAPKK